MKKRIKLLSIFFALIVSVTIFSACEGSADLGNVPPPEQINKPTELKVTGYVNEVVVGEAYISKLKVQQLVDGTWYEVPKADYVCVCDYDGFKYGEYAFNVYLTDFAGVKYTDTIVVKPKTVAIPSEYSVQHSGELINIKEYFESISNGKYTVTSYANRSDIGNYSVNLTLVNPDEDVWIDTEQNIMKSSTIAVNWSITE